MFLSELHLQQSKRAYCWEDSYPNSSLSFSLTQSLPQTFHFPTHFLFRFRKDLDIFRELLVFPLCPQGETVIIMRQRNTGSTQMAHPEFQRERETEEVEGQAMTWGLAYKFPKGSLAFPCEVYSSPGEDGPSFVHNPQFGLYFLRKKQKLKDRGLESSERRQRREKACQGPRET